MTAHTHTERVAGCYRCEISADEVELSMEIEIEDLERENRDLRALLGIMLARADGRLEVARSELADAPHDWIIDRHDDPTRDVWVFTARPAPRTQ